MPRRVLLLAGINVGGHGRLPMKDLRALLEDLGATDVQTYIQSGNVVMNWDGTAEKIADEIERHHGFRRAAWLLSTDELARRLCHPFVEATDKTLHIWVHDQDRVDLAPLRAKATTEVMAQTQGALWLLAPDGIGTSKVAAAIPKALGPCTARNLKTMTALATMASA